MMRESAKKSSCSLMDPIPLTRLKTGDDGVVLSLDGTEEFQSIMLALGIIPGKRISVASGGSKQPYIVKVDESRVMIDWKTLGRIMVQPGVYCCGKGGWR